MSGLRRRTGDYLRDGAPGIHGWLHPDSAEIVVSLARAQRRHGVGGGFDEIGIHHGLLFLLLAQCAEVGERGVAVDVFDDQSRNLDGSGRGDRQVFESHLARWAPDVPVEIVQQSSLDLDVGDAAETFGPVRLFSVDGGHTEEVAAHDLALAQSCLVPGGIVVLDDALNPFWLGVVSGLFAYLGDGGTLRPFAYSENKLYLSSDDEHARRYRRFLRRDQPALFGRARVPLRDSVVDVYVPNPSEVWAERAENRAEIDRLRRRVHRLRRRVADLEQRR